MGLPLLDQILVIGQMQLTTQLIRACLRRGIPIAYLSSNSHWLGQLQTLTNRAPCPNHLRGLEGSAAALYFRSLGCLLEDDGLGFTVHSRQHSGIKYATPNQRHHGETDAICSIRTGSQTGPPIATALR